ncbi:ABC transporter ATP-binding protein [Bradyrhizobium sp.]|uniref:ABC transporter ATP-binding protein n=1 Tax=Bradyrhizobium sp. TaxID=376 RepID=UPI004037EC84
MARLTLENAWVEFPVSLRRMGAARASYTGGQIDAGRSVVTALRDISFELREGDRLGLMGHNGAGKTTMLRLLAGAYPPTRGRCISVGSISTLFNTTPGLNMDGTGRENLIICGLHLGLRRQEIISKMDEIIDFAELGNYIDLPVRIYSAGMMTRLGFSIATCVQPEILLLDEGLATGDARFTQKAEGKIKDLIARSSILVVASHSETMLANMCGRCLLLEHGRVISDGPAKTLFESYRKSVIESARADDSDGLQRAYALGMDMLSRGEKPPLDLEEQGLRYALGIHPDDAMMLQRYVNVLSEQGKSVPPEIETRMILSLLTRNPSRLDLKDRLRAILASSAADLPEDVRASAVAASGMEDAAQGRG